MRDNAGGEDAHHVPHSSQLGWMIISSIFHIATAGLNCPFQFFLSSHVHACACPLFWGVYLHPLTLLNNTTLPFHSLLHIPRLPRASFVVVVCSLPCAAHPPFRRRAEPLFNRRPSLAGANTKLRH